MTCNEFDRVLTELEGGYSPEQELHLQTCSRCSGLVADLNAISREARLLAGDEEPNSRVWNRLEIALRQEGLIREPKHSPSRVRVAGWGHPWLVPLAASFLIMFGLLLYERGGMEPRTVQVPATAVTANLQPEVMPAEQDQLLKIVEARSPALRAAYESDFRAVNAYVRDAEQSAQKNPNDEIAQQYLTNAYDERAMVYEMAMNRVLP